jgi:hypothetical protein
MALGQADRQPRRRPASRRPPGHSDHGKVAARSSQAVPAATSSSPSRSARSSRSFVMPVAESCRHGCPRRTRSSNPRPRGCGGRSVRCAARRSSWVSSWHAMKFATSLAPTRTPSSTTSSTLLPTPGQAAGPRPMLVACGWVDQGNSRIPGAGGPRLAAGRREASYAGRTARPFRCRRWMERGARGPPRPEAPGDRG